MRRRVVPLISAVLLVLAVASAPAASADPIRTCPNAASGFVRYPIVGAPGDELPAPGVEPLWDLTAAGLISEFGSVQAGMEAFGFTSGAAFYAFLLDGWNGLDRNGDDHVCGKRFPSVPGIPDYLFNGVDNSANVPG